MAKYTDEIEQTRNGLALLINFDEFPYICSIERDDIGTADEHTIIAYMFNGEIKEWYFHCSRKQHNLLTKNYAASLAKRALDASGK